MVSWSPPTVTRNQVSKAGRRIGTGEAQPEDIAALENWRASHAFVINTFQANLRRRTQATEIVVGTRLKRRTTILNKLRRFPEMQLGRMHDIAGCRLIFPDIDSMLSFRTDFHRARFLHRRKNTEDDRWNYIVSPKPDGYRGIHDVYEYDVQSDGGTAWNGLNIEIQYRTLVQHSWSTAVEVAGLLTLNKPKLGQGNPDFIEFFAVSSEILARKYEDLNSCYPDWNWNQLLDRYRDLESRTRIMDMFRRVNSKVVEINLKKNNILVFPLVNAENENANDLSIYTFASVTRAIEEYNKLEKQLSDTADVVLVRADSFQNLRLTFRNYFADTTDFVRLIDDAVQQ